MKIEIWSSQEMVDRGLKKRIQDSWEYVFGDKVFEDLKVSDIKSKLEELYGWQKGTLKGHRVVKVDDIVYIR